MARKASSRKSSGSSFRLNAPTQMMFAISLILAVLALIGLFVPAAPLVGAYYFWFMTAGYIALAAGCTLKGI
jgi:hypothetical protein